MGPHQVAQLRRKLDLGGGAVDPRLIARVLDQNCYLKDFFLGRLPAEGAVIDVGANIGCFAVLALETLHPRLLVAFEPERSNFDLLVKNVAAVGSSARVETVQAALGSSNDRRPAMTLDHQLGELGVAESTVRVLKIDAGGAETEILEGGAGCLRNTAGLVGEIREEPSQAERLRELLGDFVVAMGPASSAAGSRPFWAVRQDLIPARQRRAFVAEAEATGLRDSLRQIEEEHRAAAREAGSKSTVFLGSFEEIQARLRLDRDVIEWQKGSLIRLRREHDDALRRAEEMNAELRRSDDSLDQRLAALGEHLAKVEDSVARATELTRRLSREAEVAMRDSVHRLEERLGVLGRRLNTIQESARQSPDLALALWSSKPWQIYHRLGTTKRAWSRKLEPLIRRLRRRRDDVDSRLLSRRPRRARSARPHQALLVDRHLPRTDRDAASLRIFNLARVLQQTGFDVAFLPHDLSADEAKASDLRREGVRVLAQPEISSLRAHLRDKGLQYDLVIVSRAAVAAECLADLRRFCPRAKVIYDTVELRYLRKLRQAELEGSEELRDAAAASRELELGAARQADLTLVTSVVDKDRLEGDAPELGVLVLPTIHDLEPGAAGFADRRDLLFVADFGRAHNADAAVWLVEAILPAIESRLPGVLVHLVGRAPGDRVRSLASENVRVSDAVPDVAPYLRKCRVSVAPLRYGAGVMGKITQTMAAGLPTVTTRIGAEAIGLVHGRDAMVAAGAEDFAASVAMLYGDEELWRRLSLAGMQRIHADFSFAAAGRSVAAMLEAVGHPWALERKLRTVEHGSPD